MTSNNKNYDGSNGIYPERTDEQHATILGRYLNDGRHLISKKITTKNLYKTISAISKTFKRVEEKANELVNGRLLTEYTTSLGEWERVVGVPDEHYDGRGSLANRQRYAIAKLSADGVSTTAELEWLCGLLGYVVTVTPGYHYWLYPDTRVSFADEEESLFTIVFEVDYANSVQNSSVFPYTFPFVFGEDFEVTMQSFIRSIIDVTVNAQFIPLVDIWENSPDGTPIYENSPDGTQIYESSN